MSLKSILFCCVIFLLACRAFCQTGVYKSSDIAVNDESYYSVRLYLNGEKYAIEFSHNFCHHLYNAYYSYGKYKRNGDRLIMKDKLNGFEIVVLCHDDNTMTFETCFASIRDVSLHYWLPWNDEYFEGSDVIMDVIRVNANKTCGERNACKRQTPLHPLRYGVYYGSPLRLELSEDGRFGYYYGDNEVLISSGRWTRMGNLLLLQDDGLNSPFFMLIKDGVLVSRFAPGAVFFDRFIMN